MFINSFPDTIELLSFFESEPIFQNAEDMHFAYKYVDANKLSVIFSFSITGGWIQAILKLKEQEVSCYLIESVTSFKIENDIHGEYISSEIISNDVKTKVEIRLQPCIMVKFTTLVR